MMESSGLKWPKADGARLENAHSLEGSKPEEGNRHCGTLGSSRWLAFGRQLRSLRTLRDGWSVCLVV